MKEYEIRKLTPQEYNKCSNIWDMKTNPDRTKKWYNELISGNRTTFIYIENDEFIGEASIVLINDDPDYTIPNKRVYLSRMVVNSQNRNRGIGGILINFLIDYSKKLGYEEISIGVDLDNVWARHLYTKKGFTDVIFEGEDEYGKYVKLLKKL